MGKSARLLGLEFDLSAQEMNKLLKEHGYLDGEPNAYGLTEKGKQHGAEQYHSRGTGGYPWYNRSWETRTWDESVSSALAADMVANASSPKPEESTVEDDSTAFEDDLSFDAHDINTGKNSDVDRAAALILAGVVVGGLLAATYVKREWRTKIKPAAKRLRDKVRKESEAPTPS